ncbi:hypothetical protein CSC43_1578 [Pseudomonas aeruginosa]|nr:hypothetical protein CSB91_3895 [Pseudomonas aeruginosa]EFQ41188.1 hypothetical protein PA39016_002280000 [Pseudomonas aeruginosa 39016]RCH24196.1 hypothetical protein CSC42_3258 [Pseudomonas aeruginosa]RCH31098.1 hypothetical protein CSC43_3901 [Pseudomonas aeruginosa]RCH32187.1 hypothetical protein CSC43_1578 [Pseudomonas aeruginosa]
MLASWSYPALENSSGLCGKAQIQRELYFNRSTKASRIYSITYLL